MRNVENRRPFTEGKNYFQGEIGPGCCPGEYGTSKAFIRNEEHVGTGEPGVNVKSSRRRTKANTAPIGEVSLPLVKENGEEEGESLPTRDGWSPPFSPPFSNRPGR